MVLLLTTVLFWAFYDRYEADGPVLLGSPASFDKAVVHGEVSRISGRYVLSVPENGRAARVDFPLTEAVGRNRVRVRARIKVDGVLEGRYYWHCARVLLLQYDAKNRWIPGHNGIATVRGTKGWRWHEKELEIHPQTARITVTLRQGGLAGTAEFDKIEAYPVRIRKSFVWWRSIFSLLWLSAAVLYFPRCRLHKRKLRVLILLNAIAILVGTLMPGDWLDGGAQRVRAEWRKISRPPPVKKPSSVSAKPSGKPPVKVKEKENEIWKIDMFNKLVGNTHRTGHFLLFASLCFLIYLSAMLERQPSRYFLKVGFDMFLFASVTEALQFLTLDRSAGMDSLFVDMLGVVVALALFLVAQPFMMRMRVRNIVCPAEGE